MVAHHRRRRRRMVATAHHRRRSPLVIRIPGAPQEPDWDDWDDPIFDDVTIAKVVWPGGKHWDRGLYKLSNGRSAFASKGLSVGQTPFDYEEIRLQGGGTRRSQWCCWPYPYAQWRRLHH